MSDLTGPEHISPDPESEPELRIEAYEVSATWRGPLPQPDQLRRYNRAFSGCAERIVAMAEAENRSRIEADRHERETRRLIIEGDVFAQKAGLILAFILAVLVIGIGAFLVYTGHLAWGTGIVGFPLIALISLFIYGKQQQTAELRDMVERNEAELSKLEPSD